MSLASATLTETHFINYHIGSNPYVKKQDLKICTFGNVWTPAYGLFAVGSESNCIDNNRYLWVLFVFTSLGGACGYLVGSNYGKNESGRFSVLRRIFVTPLGLTVIAIICFLFVTSINAMMGTAVFDNGGHSADKYGNRLRFSSVILTRDQINELSKSKSLIPNPFRHSRQDVVYVTQTVQCPRNFCGTRLSRRLDGTIGTRGFFPYPYVESGILQSNQWKHSLSQGEATLRACLKVSYSESDFQYALGSGVFKILPNSSDEWINEIKVYEYEYNHDSYHYIKSNTLSGTCRGRKYYVEVIWS